MPMIEKPENDKLIWFEGKSYIFIKRSKTRYYFMVGSSIYVAVKSNTARNDQGDLIAVEAHCIA